MTIYAENKETLSECWVKEEKLTIKEIMEFIKLEKSNEPDYEVVCDDYELGYIHALIKIEKIIKGE